jgi:hypothetical protein
LIKIRELISLTVSQNIYGLVVHVEERVEAPLEILQRSITCQSINHGCVCVCGVKIKRGESEKRGENEKEHSAAAAIHTCVHIRVELEMFRHIIPR